MVTKPRAIPLRAELLDNGVPVADVDLVTAPAFEFDFAPVQPDELPTDVTSLLPGARQGDLGNQFVFDGGLGRWRHNLISVRFSAPGTYTIRMVSGDKDEYIIQGTCMATYVIE